MGTMTRVSSRVLQYTHFPSLSVRWLANTFYREPLRYVDADGSELKDQADVEPEPKVRKDASRRTKQWKKQTFRGREVGSSGDSFDFIRTILQNSDPKRRTIVLEGEKLIADALEAGIHVTTLFHDKDLYHFKHLNPCLVSDVKTLAVTSSDMAIVSKLKTPPGIMAVAEKPSVSTIESKRPEDEVMPVLTIADTFTDAGNLGGLLRSMAASGASSLILSDLSINAWDVKVTRTAAGAHFLVPIRTFSWDDIRQRLQSVQKIFYAESPSRVANERPGTDYHQVKYFSSPSSDVALFVGSESQGFCHEARQLFADTKAERICIPMSSRFDSLNNYVAASIILFEMRKQFENIRANKLD